MYIKDHIIYYEMLNEIMAIKLEKAWTDSTIFLSFLYTLQKARWDNLGKLKRKLVNTRKCTDYYF